MPRVGKREGAGRKPKAGALGKPGKILAAVDAARVLAELEKLGFSNMGDYMRAGPDGEPVLDFSKLSRDQMAALQEVTVETFLDGKGDAAREVRRVRFKLYDKRSVLVKLGERAGLFKPAAPQQGDRPATPAGKKAAAAAAAETAGEGTEWGGDLDAPSSSAVN